MIGDIKKMYFECLFCRIHDRLVDCKGIWLSCRGRLVFRLIFDIACFLSCRGCSSFDRRYRLYLDRFWFRWDMLGILILWLWFSFVVLLFRLEWRSLCRWGDRSFWLVDCRVLLVFRWYFLGYSEIYFFSNVIFLFLLYIENMRLAFWNRLVLLGIVYRFHIFCTWHRSYFRDLQGFIPFLLDIVCYRSHIQAS